MGQGYSRLGSRRRSGAWQWLLIGFFPGLLCGGLIFFSLVYFEVIGGFGGDPDVIEVTREIQVGIVVTATPDPAATEAVRIVTTTPEPTTPVEEAQVVLPTQTPFSTPVVVNPADSNPTPAGDDPSTAAQDAAAGGVPQPTVPDSSADTTQPNTNASGDQAAQVVSNPSTLVTVQGGTFGMGTTLLEITQAANNCITRDGGQCDPSFGEDSIGPIQVELDTFQIEQTEVTFDQYIDFLNYLNAQGIRHTSGCNGFPCIQTQNERPDAAVIAFDGGNYFLPTRLETLRNHPAYGVTWYGAQAYCEALGRRLPTEAEWEYAARSGGQDNIWPWGNTFFADRANWRIPAIQEAGQATVPVSDLAAGANGLGLLHMSGNVAEWVQDWYDPNYYFTMSQQAQTTGQPVSNPRGPAGGTQRVLRGGSFNALPFFARTYHRQEDFPAPETPNATYPLWVGFRCAADGEGSVSVPGGTGVDPASLGLEVPATGGDTTPNAQPTAAAVPPEAEDSGEEGSRG